MLFLPFANVAGGGHRIVSFYATERNRCIQHNELAFPHNDTRSFLFTHKQSIVRGNLSLLCASILRTLFLRPRHE